MPNFDQIFDQYFEKIFRFVNRRIANTQDVEDVVSEIFEAVWKRHSTLLTTEHQRNFIYSVTVNKVNSFLRALYKVPITYSSEAIEKMDAPEPDHTDSMSGKDNLIDVITQAVKQLDPRDQLFYRLRYQENHTFREISQKMSLTENNCKVINNRLLKKLKNFTLHP